MTAGKIHTNWLRLLTDYRNHLENEAKINFFKSTQRKTKNKVALVVNWIIYCQEENRRNRDFSARECLQWLEQHAASNSSETPKNTEAKRKNLSPLHLLTQRRTPLLLFSFQVLLVLFTFPLSLPILLLHAWHTRNSLRFWETAGQH